MVTVVPLTANVSRIFPFQILLTAGETGLPVNSKAQAEQVRSLSTERFVRLPGRVPVPRMRELGDAFAYTFPYISKGVYASAS